MFVPLETPHLAALVQSVMAADSQMVWDLAATNADTALVSVTRYALFNDLDRRSFYGQGGFPEPFLVGDSGLEINEARLDWLRSETGDANSDIVKAEVQKGFGLLTVEVPYVRNRADGETTQGFDNLDPDGCYPLYGFVSHKAIFDTTVGLVLVLFLLCWP